MERFALILGVSSGFGKAAALELAKGGVSIFGVHLDRKGGLEVVERLKGDIERAGVRAVFFNLNAADDSKRSSVIEEMTRLKNESSFRLRVFLHSLAFGTLKPFVAKSPKERVNRSQLEMTIDVMANSFLYWMQDLYGAGFLEQGTQAYAMTSAGGTRVWPSYGPVSVAKAALEAHVRQLAYELIPSGVSVNAILAGVTRTPALEKIPGAEQMVNVALERSSAGRLTAPEDVGRLIATVALSPFDNTWCTGNTIRVDGGENLAG